MYYKFVNLAWPFMYFGGLKWPQNSDFFRYGMTFFSIVTSSLDKIFLGDRWSANGGHNISSNLTFGGPPGFN